MTTRLIGSNPWFDPKPRNPSATQPGRPAARPVGPCDSCGRTNTLRETIRRQGVVLTICVDPTPCREYAQRTGQWLGLPVITLHRAA